MSDPSHPAKSRVLANVTTPANQDLLSVTGLTAGYRGRAVIYDMALKVRRGEIVVILGPNGAGKTTTLKSVVGLIKPMAGTVDYNGSRWRTDRPWSAARSGISFIPAERFTFAQLTVEENLALGAYTQNDLTKVRQRRQQVTEMFPILGRRLGQKAGTMSGGEQRMLSLAVALMAGPSLLLLDEPSLGLAPAVVQQIMNVLSQLADQQGLSVLMVEQNVAQVLPIADRVYVMRSGRIILSQSAEEMRQREQWWDLF
jgi:branched-chain amino acid transport system ATP-binding protein